MKKIEIQDINKLRHICLNAQLEKDIDVSFKQHGHKFSGLGNYYKSGKFEEREFKIGTHIPIAIWNREKDKDRERNGEKYNDILTWGIRFTWIREMLFQFSYFVKDDEFLYFGKKLMKGGGGFNSYYKDCETKGINEKEATNLLIQSLPNSINIQDKSFLSLTKIALSDLYDKNKENQILYQILYAIAECLLIQYLIIDKKITQKIIIEDERSNKRQILSTEDKKDIEVAAMKFVKERWEQEGFPMKDVSDKRGEDWGYDFEAEGEDTYYVEVKGTTSQGNWNIIMTKNEFNASEKYRDNYFLCIVQFDNKEDLNVKNYEEIQYPTKDENLEFKPYTYTVTKK